MVIAGNVVTSIPGTKGEDGFKVAGNARYQIVAGSIIESNVRASGLDLVAVQDYITIAYNTVGGIADYQSATLGKDGSDNVEAFGNEFVTFAFSGDNSATIGGTGANRFELREPGYPSLRPDGWEAWNFNVHHNVFDANLGDSGRFVFIGGQESRFADNFVRGFVRLRTASGSLPHQFDSFNNDIEDNIFTEGNYYQPDDGNDAGNRVSGNKVGVRRDFTTPVGADNLPGDYLHICPWDIALQASPGCTGGTPPTHGQGMVARRACPSPASARGSTEGGTASVYRCANIKGATEFGHATSGSEGSCPSTAAPSSPVLPRASRAPGTVSSKAPPTRPTTPLSGAPTLASPASPALAGRRRRSGCGGQGAKRPVDGSKRG